MGETILNDELTSKNGEDSAAAPPDTEVIAEEQEKQNSTFTQAELDSMVQKPITDVKRESEQRDSMTLEERAAALEQREYELEQRELASAARDLLRRKSLPEEFADIMNFTSKDNLSEQINALESVLQKHHQSQPIQLCGAVPGASAYASLDAVEDAFRQGFNR